jgi:hypothetical protein
LLASAIMTPVALPEKHLNGLPQLMGDRLFAQAWRSFQTEVSFSRQHALKRGRGKHEGQDDDAA